MVHTRIRMKNLATVLLVSATVLFGCLVYDQVTRRPEAFGMSPGTLVQLSSSHVPTAEDVDEQRALNRQIRHDLIDMTGSA